MSNASDACTAESTDTRSSTSTTTTDTTDSGSDSGSGAGSDSGGQDAAPQGGGAGGVDVSARARMLYWRRSGGGDAMGASAWHYVVGYQPDAGQALAELQETVLADGNYYHGAGEFASMAELNEVRNTEEEFWEESTHSILDMMTFTGPDGPDDVAVVRQLRDDEVRASFGHDRPTVADFERFIKGDWMVNRWEGHATVLYRDGNPDGLAFWAISGD